MDSLVAKYGSAILMVLGAGVSIYLTLCAASLVMLVRRRYIRAGETAIMYGNGNPNAGTSKVLRLDGWGKYAAVMLDPVGAIRRDLITKDANGNWFYRYDD